MDSPSGAASRSLNNGDVLTSIDGRDAVSLSPLGVFAAINTSLDVPVPVIVQRKGERLAISLGASDKKPAAGKPGATQAFVSGAQDAPDFSLPNLRGAPVTLSAQKGHWALVSFWATWCEPCQGEAVIFNRLTKMYPRQLTILALAVNDDWGKLNSFSEKQRPLYTVLNAGSIEDRPAISYGVAFPHGSATVPVNVLVRPDGTVAYVEAGGYDSGSMMEKEVSAFIDGR